jgi:ABC-type transport system involved in cytochrome c biogenesis ATPase subunit
VSSRAPTSAYDVYSRPLAELNRQLAAVDGVRELARQRVLQVEERLSSLHGSSEVEGSEVWLSELHTRATEASSVVQSIEDSLVELARQIHDSLKGELSAVTDLYGPPSRFIAASPVVKNAGLEFRAELRVVSRMQSLSNLVDGRRSPDLIPWISRLPETIDGQDWDQIGPQLRSSFLRLSHERGSDTGVTRHPDEALRKDFTVIEFITELLALEWLEVRFGLTGNGLPLAQLSPGQRGLVLALFYLIVDLRIAPLLLDQPEENLDNATIATLLVPAIQEAAGRRQTIIVTHNANLAIVGDADQIVHCTVTDGVFGVTSGSISELGIAQDVVDILEGTKPAFDKRGHRYEVFPLQ